MLLEVSTLSSIRPPVKSALLAHSLARKDLTVALLVQREVSPAGTGQKFAIFVLLVPTATKLDLCCAVSAIQEAMQTIPDPQCANSVQKVAMPAGTGQKFVISVLLVPTATKLDLCCAISAIQEAMQTIPDPQCANSVQKVAMPAGTGQKFVISVLLVAIATKLVLCCAISAIQEAMQTIPDPQCANSVQKVAMPAGTGQKFVISVLLVPTATKLDLCCAISAIQEAMQTIPDPQCANSVQKVAMLAGTGQKFVISVLLVAIATKLDLCCAISAIQEAMQTIPDPQCANSV